jgi:acyl dehydratase
MVEVETAKDLASLIGQKIGTSEWIEIDQKMINAFADVTNDPMWIHVDVERASREMPDGKTIAHGLLVLSLVPGLAQTIYKVKRRSRALNYGLNRVRYTGQVQVGSRVRTHQTIKAVDVIEGGARITSEHLVEIEGRSRPALVAETLVVMYD